MSASTEEAPEKTPAQSFLVWLYRFNNLLLIPMFTLLVLETSAGKGAELLVAGYQPSLFFCAFFMTEWVLGLVLSTERIAYLKSPSNIVDFISSIPFGFFFQSARLARLVRVARLLRVIWRATRFKGKGGRMVQIVGMMAATASAGGLALRIVEPESVESISEGIWWALVTLSTVGYGDIAPETALGRVVAGVLMVFGVGVFGYVAGMMASILENLEEQEELEEISETQDELVDLIKRLEGRVADLQTEVRLVASLMQEQVDSRDG